MSASISYWQKSHDQSNRTFYIIGSGIVGLTTAIYLKKALSHLDLVILEKASICGGASIRNAGFSCFGSPSELIDDIHRVGEDEMINTVKLRWDGLQKLKELVKNYNIDYHQLGSYEVFSSTSLVESVIEKLDYINGLISEVFKSDKVFSIRKDLEDICSPYQSVFTSFEGQLNPYKMVMALRMEALALGVVIFNNQYVESIDYNNKIIHTANRQLQASEIIICTNAYTSELLDIEDCKPVRNQVFVTNPIEDLKFKGNIHIDQGYVYIRNIGKRLLIGGARNRFATIEETSTFGNTSEVESHLKTVLADAIPKSRFVTFEHKWSGILAVGNAKKAIVQKHSNGCYLGVRLGGMGVAIGTEVGSRLALKIIEDYTY